NYGRVLAGEASRIHHLRRPELCHNQSAGPGRRNSPKYRVGIPNHIGEQLASVDLALAHAGLPVVRAERRGPSPRQCLHPCFEFGLMCKPMVVTLPSVLLLLDYWPLGRMASSPSVGALERQSVGKVSPRSVAAVRRLTPAATFRRLVFEKIPFLLLTLGSCV